MTDQPKLQHGSFSLVKLLLLLLLAATSGLVVWAHHTHDRFEFLTCLTVAFCGGSSAGVIFRVPLVATWAVMATAGGLFEGVYLGWRWYGWMGTAPGGLVGIGLGLIVTLLLCMGLSFILVMSGIDPFVNADEDKTE